MNNESNIQDKKNLLVEKLFQMYIMLLAAFCFRISLKSFR